MRMKTIRFLRIILGLAVWAGVLLGGWWCVDGPFVAQGTAASQLAPTLWRYATGERQTALAKLPAPTYLALGDPVFVIEGDGAARRIGEVRNLGAAEGIQPVRAGRVQTAEVLFFPTAPNIGADAQLVYYQTPDSMEWVLRTMLPPEKRNRIAGQLRAAFDRHHEEIVEALKPVVIASLREGAAVLEDDIAAAIAKRKTDFERLGAKYQQDIVRQEIVPLVKKEIWPVVRRHAEPLANDVGREIWDRVSLWRFTWRYVYDKMPLVPDKQLTKKEWNRVVDKEIVPVLEKHSDDFVRVTQRTLSDVARNEKVRGVLRASLSKMIDDPELQRLIGEVVREVVVDNPRLHEVMKRHWTSPEAKQAFRLASQRMEGTVEEIINGVFGSPDLGITPEFARVVRAQVLGKDKRWLVLEAGTNASKRPRSARPAKLALNVRYGGEPAVNPFLQMLRDQR